LKRFAFTMIELVFVIVVIGIITAVMLPRIDRDNVYEAAQQVISHIKYTQHLAMIDNKYDDNNTDWYKERWQIGFTSCTSGDIAYTIHSDEAAYGVLPARAETARDPLSKLRLYHNNCLQDPAQDDGQVNLTNNFNIDSMDFTGCANVQHIAFDTMGRPFTNVSNSTSSTASYMTAVCDIVLIVNNDSNATIRIEPETGYTRLLSIN